MHCSRPSPGASGRPRRRWRWLVGHQRWDVEQYGLPERDIELRVFGNGQYYGRFMLRPGPRSRPTLQARLVAVTLADLAGRALSNPSSARSDG